MEKKDIEIIVYSFGSYITNLRKSKIRNFKMSAHHLDYLDELESESIHIFREVAGQFEKPALLFSGGKDSIVLVHLALKAFRPGKFPFPLVHIDTGHNFPEALQFRDQLAKKIDEKLVVRLVEDTIKAKNLQNRRESSPAATSCRHTLCSTPLKSLGSMPALVEPGEMKKKREPRKGSFL